MQVKDVMTTPVHLVEPDTSLVVAARKMRDENVGSLPVGEGGELLGMITDRDIVVRCLAEDQNCAKTAVRDVMSAELLCCFEDQPVEAAARLMAEHRVRRLPVLGRDHRLVGILSRDDLAGRRELTTKPHRVVFYREVITSGSGQPHKVPLAIVHITDRHAREEVEAAAIKTFERDRGGHPWREVADGYEVIDPE